MILSILDSMRASLDNLNDRERKLVGLLGSVAAAMMFFLPLWLTTSAIGDVETENGELRSALRSISLAQTELAQRRQEREDAQERYDTPAPPLGSFLEAKANEAGFERPLELTDQPEKVTDAFTRRHVRANLPGIGLRTVVDMITEIENSPYPVAVERLQIEHFQAGDRYNVEVGVITFDRNSRGDDDDGDDDDDDPSSMTRGSMRSGPPAP